VLPVGQASKMGEGMTVHFYLAWEGRSGRKSGANIMGFRHPMYVTCQAATNSGVLVRCAQAVFSS
jgi:hypothetical protein